MKKISAEKEDNLTNYRYLQNSSKNKIIMSLSSLTLKIVKSSSDLRATSLTISGQIRFPVQRKLITLFLFISYQFLS